MNNERFYKAPASDLDSQDESLLPVADILRSTLHRLVRERYSLIPALILPFLLIQVCMASYWLIPRAIDPANVLTASYWLPFVFIAVGIVGMIFWGLLAVACHRVMLDDEDKPGVIDGIWLGSRQIRYLMKALVLGLPAALIWGLLIFLGMQYVLPLIALPDQELLSDFVFTVGLQLAFFPVHYLIARFSLALPAAALGDPMSFRQAWQESSRNGWRLVILLMLAPLLLDLLQPFVNAAQAFAFWPFLIMSSALNFFVAIFSISTLSLSYEWFMQNDLGA